MVARTVIESIAGAQMFISSGIPATYDQAGYEGTDQIPTWTKIGEVENYGNYGVTANISKFTPVDTSVTTKIKGSKDYGKMSLILGGLPGDAGQAILAAASESNNHYSVKILYPDTVVHYLDVLVGKFEYQLGTVDTVQRTAVDFEVCRAPVIVAQA